MTSYFRFDFEGKPTPSQKSGGTTRGLVSSNNAMVKTPHVGQGLGGTLLMVAKFLKGS